MDERDLVESWNRAFPEGTSAMSSYQRVSIISRAFVLGGVACVWTLELPYPVKLNSLHAEEAFQADPGVGVALDVECEVEGCEAEAIARHDGQDVCDEHGDPAEEPARELEPFTPEVLLQRGLAQRMHDGDTEATGERCAFPVEQLRFGYSCSSPECGWTIDGAELLAQAFGQTEEG